MYGTVSGIQICSHQHPGSSSKPWDLKIFERHLRLKMAKPVCVESLVPGSTTLESMQPSSHIRQRRVAPWQVGGGGGCSVLATAAGGHFIRCLPGVLDCSTNPSLWPACAGIRAIRKHRAPQEPRSHFRNPWHGANFSVFNAAVPWAKSWESCIT